MSATGARPPRRGELAAVLVLDALTVLLPLAFFLDRIAPGLAWLDSGELAASSWSLGTSHPPGHPLYMFVAHFLAHLVPGSVAFRMNLVSAAFAVASIVAARALIADVLDWTAGPAHAGGRLIARACATAGALTLAFVPAFALQAVRAEVYTLAFLLETLLVHACVRLMISREDRPAIVGAMFLAGALGLCVHDASFVLLAPVALLALLAAARDEASAARLARASLGPAAAGLATGLVPLAYGPLRSAAAPFVDYGHVGSLADMARVLSAAAYRHAPASASLASAAETGPAALWQVSGAHLIPAVLLVAAAGAVVVARRSPLVLAALVSAVALPFAGLILQGGLYPGNPDHGAYVFPSLLVVVTLAAAGARSLALLPFMRRSWGPSSPVPAILASALALTLCVSQALGRSQAIDLGRSTSAEAHADLLDRILPADAVVLLNNDEVAFPLVYIQVAEGRRLDVTAASALAQGTLRPARGRPVLWDHSGRSPFEPGRLVPFYHLGLVVPPGAAAPRTGGAVELASLFASMLAGLDPSGADAFALGRLARGPLAHTAIAYYDGGDVESAIVVDTLALGLSPDEPLVHYNRALAFEAAGRRDLAIADLERARDGGFDAGLVEAALERLGDQNR